MIGGGNHFDVLIPLADIDPEGQNYQVIRGTEFDNPYVLFVTGIEPYTTVIKYMPVGFDRWDAYKAHESIARAKAADLLRTAFPESNINRESSIVWDDQSLPTCEVVLRITPAGVLARPRRRLPQPVRGAHL
jgi:hypothetical protein